MPRHLSRERWRAGIWMRNATIPALTLAVALLVDDLGQGFARLTGPRAGSSGLLVRVAQRDHGAHHALGRDAQDLLGGRSPFPDEPPDTRAETVRQGGEHDPLAQAPLVVGLLLGSFSR